MIRISFLYLFITDSAVDEKIIIATTRPETMLGDTAIAVHPDDKRYKVRRSAISASRVSPGLILPT